MHMRTPLQLQAVRSHLPTPMAHASCGARGAMEGTGRRASLQPAIMGPAIWAAHYAKRRSCRGSQSFGTSPQRANASGVQQPAAQRAGIFVFERHTCPDKQQGAMLRTLRRKCSLTWCSPEGRVVVWLRSACECHGHGALRG